MQSKTNSPNVTYNIQFYNVFVYLIDVFVYTIDSKSNCKLLKILLQQRGVLVCDACHDGTEAIELMLRSQSTRSLSYYDVVFMDSNMPKMVIISISM